MATAKHDTVEKEVKEESVPAANSVERVLNNFKSNIHSIVDYFINFGELAVSADRATSERIRKIVESSFAKLGIDPAAEEMDDKQLDEIENENPGKLEEMLNSLGQVLMKEKPPVRNFDIFSRSSFLMLNNYFEYLLSDLMSYYYNKYQTSLNEKKFDFTLKEINEYESIVEAVKAFVTKEVESLMVELSFDKLLEHFDVKLKIDNEKAFINWDLLAECRERRHLIVHNSSVVNKKYIVRTGNPFKFNIGDIVEIDSDYFSKACNEFYLAGLIISYNCWGRWDSKEIDACTRDVLDESFDLLDKHQYKLTGKLSEFAMKKIEARSEEQEDYLARINFNRLIAIKKTEKKSVLEKELKKVKVGTAAPIFRLAHAILSDKHEDVPSLVKRVKALGEMDLEVYESWPIFDFIRDLPELDAEIRKELEVQSSDDSVDADGSPELEDKE